MMRKTPKVIIKSKFKTREGSGLLNMDTSSRAVLIGRQLDAGQSTCGLVGKVSEMSSGNNILDYSVWLDLSFPHVVGIFGSRGTGKSFNLGSMIECLAGIPSITDGSVLSNSIVILDVQNQFWTMASSPCESLPEDSSQLKDLSRWGLAPTVVSNVHFWTPRRNDSGLPAAKVFRISPKQLQVDDWLAILEQERFSPMGQALVDLLRISDDHSPCALANLAQPNTLPSFQSTTIDSLRWRLQATAEMGLVGEPGMGISEFLTPGRTSVVLLRHLPDNMRALTAGVLTRLLATQMNVHHQSRKIARRLGKGEPKGTLPERLWIIVDEIHIIAPNEGKTPASGPLVDYVKRGRDTGLSLIFATQQPSAVDTRLMSQTDITFTHKLGFEADIQASVHRMPTRNSHAYTYEERKIPSVGDVIRSLDTGEAIVADAASGRSFIEKVRPRLSAHGGNTPIHED